MTVEVAIQQALNGISFGALLFILAAGLSLIFGMMDVINLEHGAFYMLGAYIALAAVQRTGNFWLALVLAPLLVGALGLVIEPLLLRRLRGRHLDQVLLTIGISLVIVDLVGRVAGRRHRPRLRDDVRRRRGARRDRRRHRRAGIRCVPGDGRRCAHLLAHRRRGRRARHAFGCHRRRRARRTRGHVRQGPLPSVRARAHLRDRGVRPVAAADRPPRPRAHRAMRRGALIAGAAVAALALVTFPVWTSEWESSRYATTVLRDMLVLAILALSLDLLV